MQHDTMTSQIEHVIEELALTGAEWSVDRHAAVVERACEVLPDITQAAGSIAAHLAAAGNNAHALDLLIRSAQTRAAAGDLQHSIQLYDAVLANDAPHCDAAIARMRIRERIGMPDPATAWSELAQMLASCGDSRASYAWYMACIVDPDAAHARAALAAAGGAWHDRLQAVEHYLDGNIQSAIDIDQRLLAVARSESNQLLEAYVLLGLSVSYSQCGQTSIAMDFARASIVAARHLGIERLEIVGHFNLATMCGEAALGHDAVEVLGDAYTRARLQHADVWIREAGVRLAQALGRIGRVRDAQRVLDELYDEDWLPASYDDCIAAVIMADVLLMAGEVRAAARLAGCAQSLHGTDPSIGCEVELIGERIRRFDNSGALPRIDVTDRCPDDQEPSVHVARSMWVVRSAGLADFSQQLPRVNHEIREVREAVPIEVLARAERDATVEAVTTQHMDPLRAIADMWGAAGLLRDRVQCLLSVARILQRFHRDGDAVELLAGAYASSAAMGDVECMTAASRALESIVAHNGGGDAPLASNSLLAGLNMDELAQVRAIAHPSRHVTDEVIYEVGEPLAVYRVVRSGSVRLEHVGADGRTLTSALVGAGSAFGEEAFIGEGVSTVRAVTAEPALIDAYDAVELRRFMRDLPRLASNLFEVLGQRLVAARVLTHRVALASISARLAAVLLDLGAARGVRRMDGSVQIDRKLTQSDIAAMVGTRRESVNELLRRWQADGIITRVGRAIHLVDEARLAMLASDAQ